MKKTKNNMWKVLSGFNRNKNSQNMPSGNDFFLHFEKKTIPHWNDYFNYEYENKAISTLAKINNVSACNSELDLRYDILNDNFTHEEILSCINLLKNGKSAGIDNLSAEFIKSDSTRIASDLVALYNYVIENRSFPQVWTDGLRNPIYKTGSVDITSNYRGITVLPIFEKVFEMAVTRRLEFIDDTFNTQDRYNNGFSKGMRTADNIFILQSVIERQLTLGQHLIVIFVDFTQAFDLVNRNILFFKLELTGLKGRVIDTLRNLYSKTSFRVKHNGEFSESIKENTGVNQGGNASPYLFKKYLSDLKTYLDDYTGVILNEELLIHLLWADDLILLSTNVADSQKQLDGLSKFCKPNQMLVNCIKTKCLLFGNQPEPALLFNDKRIDVVNSYKALGNMISAIKTCSGNIFSANSGYLSDQARKAHFGIQKQCRNIGDIPSHCKLNLYESLVQPILTYGSEVWGHDTNSTKTVDKAFHRYLRYVLRVKMGTSIAMIEGECGLMPPSIKCHASCLLYFIRLNNLPDGSIVKNAFYESMYLSELGYTSWVSRVCELADSYDLDLKSYTFSDKTKYSIKEIVRKKYIVDWNTKLHSIETNPILRTYSLFKFDFKLEPYLFHIKNNKYRNAMSRFRTSSHNLEIEKGRHAHPKTPLDKRLCKTCKVLEDEMHFLLHCSLYKTSREILIGKVADQYPLFNELSHEDKFTFLLSYNDPQILTWTAKFIHDSLQTRNCIIN